MKRAHSLEYRVYRAKLNVKRATRRERPAAKRKLERLKRALDTWKLCVLMVRARDVGIEHIPGEMYSDLRRRVLLKLVFTPASNNKRELRRMLQR